MDANTEKLTKDYRNVYWEIRQYVSALSLASWDMNTGAPLKGFAALGEQFSFFTDKYFRLAFSDEAGEVINQLLAKKEELAPDFVRELTLAQEEYRLNRAVPPALVAEHAAFMAESDALWKQAKEAADYSIFRPALEKMVGYTTEILAHQGFSDPKTRYDALLHQFEPNMKAADFWQIANALTEAIPPMLKEIGDKGAQDINPALRSYCAPEKQRELSLSIVKRMGYDLGAGRIDETVHPFCTFIRPGDVRVTTHTYENDVLNGISSCMHEVGHALYMQGIEPAVMATGLNDAPSYGMHESQSRFWEILVGTGFPFSQFLQKELAGAFPHLAGVTPGALYRHQNAVIPNTVRLESSELAYNLHIILRFMLEERLMAGTLSPRDLPEAWGELSLSLLGARPENDARGCLQDSHWSSGSFGYFPSYTIGNLCAVQFYNAMKKSIPNAEEQFAKGELKEAQQWLYENIHRHGKRFTRNEMLVNITGEPLNPAHFVGYIQEKFGALYNLTVR